MYSEKSKADDVQFILDLITKIGEEIPAADMNNVNIAGSFLASTSFEYTEVITSRHKQRSSFDLPASHQYWS